MGSEDPLQKIFLKGIFVQEGSSGTRFDHGQFEIKTFPIYAPPNYTPQMVQKSSTGGVLISNGLAHSADLIKICTPSV